MRLDTRSQDAVLETTGGVFAQNEMEWAPWLRTTAGLRVDASRFRVNALDTANSGTTSAGLVSPKGGVTIGPWKGTEFYVNAGTGFHSNDARGTTITRDGDGNPVDRVTPLVRALGAEVGARTVAIPHLQSTLTVWTLHLDSELVFSGDDGPATSLVNLQAGYRLASKVKLAVDVFNLFNAADGDIDYFYTSRLPGESPSGVDDIHTHPTLPRTARVNLIVGF